MGQKRQGGLKVVRHAKVDFVLVSLTDKQRVLVAIWRNPIKSQMLNRVGTPRMALGIDIPSQLSL